MRQQFPSFDKGLRRLRAFKDGETDPEGEACMWNCHVLHETVWRGEKKKKKEKKEERSCQLFRHGAGYCAVNKISSAHVTITLVVNGSTGWLYIYIYIYLSKIRKEAPFYLSRNWVRKETTLGEPVLWGNWKKKKEKIVRSNEMGWDDISRMQTRIII